MRRKTSGGTVIRRLIVLSLLAGCSKGGWAEVSGSISEVDFNEVKTVFHGGSYILLFDEEVDCLDVSWAEGSYQDGEAPTDVAFNALQFRTDNDSFTVGTFSVEGNGEVSAQGLLNATDEFRTERGRQGTVTIDEVAENDSTIEGTFDVEFTEGSVSGEFHTEFCRNLH